MGRAIIITLDFETPGRPERLAQAFATGVFELITEGTRKHFQPGQEACARQCFLELDRHSQEYISLDELGIDCLNMFMRACKAGLDEYLSTGKTAWGTCHEAARVEANAQEWQQLIKKLYAAKFWKELGVRVSLFEPLLDVPVIRPMTDFKIAEGPGAGQMLDFMLSPDTPEEKMNMNLNLMKSPRHVECMRDRIEAHLVNADIVAINLKTLTPENQKLMEAMILDSFPPADKERLRIMR